MLYLRFVTHLQFFIARMIKKEELPEKDDFLLASVKQRFPKRVSGGLENQGVRSRRDGCLSKSGRTALSNTAYFKGVLNEENIGCTIYKDLLVVLRLLIPWKILLTVRR